MASHDEFGPKSTERTCAVTKVYRSRDHGQNWTNIARVDGQFWSTLFVRKGGLYLIGTDKHHGNAVIRRSLDGGRTWSSPTNEQTGLLRGNSEYHCAPVPVIEHAGRLWRAMERREPPTGWAVSLCAGMFSISLDADLLQSRNWTFSKFLPSDEQWLNRSFGGWLEGNAVVAPNGQLVNLLRVDTPGYPEKAALVEIDVAGQTASFDPKTGFIDMPGGAKKFTVRYDAKSSRYWSLVTLVPERHQKAGPPGRIRNTLALACSADLRAWIVRSILLYHPDTANHGFQYVDWLYDGDDIVAACRTAFDDAEGGAHNMHDANFLTFHRIVGFRQKTSNPDQLVPTL